MSNENDEIPQYDFDEMRKKLSEVEDEIITNTLTWIKEFSEKTLEELIDEHDIVKTLGDIKYRKRGDIYDNKY